MSAVPVLSPPGSTPSSWPATKGGSGAGIGGVSMLVDSLSNAWLGRGLRVPSHEGLFS